MYKILVVSISCLVVFSACSADDADSSKSSAISANSQQPSRTAYIDPVTGELISKPSDYQLEQLKAANQARPELRQQFQQPIIEERMPSGAYKVRVPQSLHSQLTATINADGKLKVQHQSPITSTKQKATSQ